MSASSSPSRHRGRRSLISQHSDEDIAAARQRLQAYLQQQGGISQAEAARLAGTLSAKLGAAADQLVPVPLQWFVGRGMRPAQAAAVVERICESAGDASYIRQWPTWQPLFEANWQLADSYLTAYRRQQRENKQRPLKASESMAVMLSSMPSRYRLLAVPDLPSKLEALQQGQLGLSAAEVGQLLAAGAALTGSPATVAAAIQWLMQFTGSSEGAAGMLRGGPTLLDMTAATLDAKVAALQAAWQGMLQPGQLRELVQRTPMVVASCSLERYAPAAAVLRSWFPQPEQLLPVLQRASKLLAASAATLQANQTMLTSPPLSLSREDFLARVRASPQSFAMNLAGTKTAHKLAFLTQVGGVPLDRALSASHLSYLTRSMEALAGRYFLLTEHGVPVARHADGGIGLSHSTVGLPFLLHLMWRHDSQGHLPPDDDAALAYITRWLAAWPETDSGRRWAEAPKSTSKS